MHRVASLGANVVLALACACGALAFAAQAGDGKPPAERKARLDVRVVAAEDSRALPGVKLILEPIAAIEELPDLALAVALERIAVQLNTSASGEASFEVEAGRAYRLVGLLEGPVNCWFLRTVGGLEADEVRELRVKVPTRAERRVSGRVLSAGAKRPIPGARVRPLLLDVAPIRFEQTHARRLLPGTTTADDGSFSLRVSDWFAVQLLVSAPECAPVQVSIPMTELAVRAASGTEDWPSTPPADVELQVLLEPDTERVLRVVDSRGEPQAEVEVAILNHGLSQQVEVELGMPSVQVPADRFLASTDAQGQCRVPSSLLAEHTEFDLLREGHWLDRIVFRSLPKSNASTPLVLVLRQSPRVRGRALTPDGKPAADVELHLFQLWPGSARRIHESSGALGSTRTGADGGFEFEHARLPGKGFEWCVAPPVPRLDPRMADPSAIAPIAFVVQLDEQGIPQPVELTIWRGGYIGGRVLDSAGSPAAGVGVHLKHVDDPSEMYDLSAADGSFLLGPLATSEFLLHADGNALLAPTRPAAVRTGQRDLVLQLEPACWLRFTVRDGDKTINSSLWIDLQPRVEFGQAPERIGDVRQTDDGGLEIGPLAAGSYDLYVKRQDRNEHVATLGLELRAGERRSFELPLVPPAILLVRNPKAARESVRVLVRVDDGVLEVLEIAPGDARRVVRPPGTAELRVEGPGASRHRLALSAGSTTEFVVP